MGTLLAIICLSQVSISLSKKLKSKHRKAHQIHLVRDMNGFNADLHQVYRRDPTVTTMAKLGEYNLPAPYTTISASNSNTSTLPNVGYLGKTAEVIDPQIVMRNRQGISVVKQTPAHIGYRNERQTVNALNMNTGKVETHTTNKKVPIYGHINEVKDVFKNNIRSYNFRY